MQVVVAALIASASCLGLSGMRPRPTMAAHSRANSCARRRSAGTGHTGVLLKSSQLFFKVGMAVPELFCTTDAGAAQADESRGPGWLASPRGRNL